MCQINSYKIYLFFVFLVSPKIWRVRYRKVIFKGNVHAVPKKCLHYNKWVYIGGLKGGGVYTPLVGGFLLEFDRYYKVSAI